MIIVRYLTREILSLWGAIMGILLFVVLSNRLIAYLGKAAKGELPIALVAKALGFYIPELLAYLAPLGFFIACLFAYGRLYADSEMTVLQLHGWTLSKLLKYTLSVSTVVGMLVLLLTVWFVPQMIAKRTQVLEQGLASGMIHSLTPGRFQVFQHGRALVYVGDRNAQGEVKDIFIARQKKDKPNQWSVLLAKEGHMQVKSSQPNVLLTSGQLYTGVPGTLEYQHITFGKHQRSLELPTHPVSKNDPSTASFSQLWTSDKIEDKAQWQWRITAGLSVLIFALFVLPLSKVDPRAGRFARFVPAIVIYIIFYQLLFLSKKWMISGYLPPYVGLWWVMLLFLGLGAVSLAWMVRRRGR